MLSGALAYGLAPPCSINISSSGDRWSSNSAVVSSGLASISARPDNVLRDHIAYISTKRRRSKKMNKHKLKKRRKKLRKNTKISRQL